MNIYNTKYQFLYCFDENYNKQAFTSMISLLENLESPVEINIIHPDENLMKEVPLRILNHPKLIKLNIHNFINAGYDFPNIDDSHVSEATYYRLFIEDYIEKEVSFIVYLDADIICMQNPEEYLNKEINTLSNSKNVLSVRTEKVVQSNDEVFKRLKINQTYFNAGVMVINYERWLKDEITNNLLLELKKIEKAINFWDQDVLNSYFNGEYNELNNYLNYDSQKFDDSIKGDIIFLHYIGSKKPWLTSGAFIKSAFLYHERYSDVYENRFHIVHKWKVGSIKELVYSVLNFSFFRIQNKASYLLHFMKSLL